MSEKTNQIHLSEIRQQYFAVLGEDTAKRITPFEKAGLYVAPLHRVSFSAWLIDTVLLNGIAIGAGVLYYTHSDDPDKAAGTGVIIVFLMLTLPFLYGWFYRDGRALGGLLTGTRLVRIHDGSRIGWTKAGWAVFIRTFLMPFFFWTILDGGVVTQSRCSIDIAGTERLRATMR